MSFRGTFDHRFALATRVALAVGMLALFASGCDQKAKSGSRRGPASQSNPQGGLFNSVVDNLDHLEQFDAGKMLPQICDRLNQWYQQEKPSIAWQPDPLLATLPEELQNLPSVKTLDSMQYRLTDAWYLQESVWLRDISKVARGDQFEDLAVAERLFDWTVRNLQLEPDVDVKDEQIPHRPYQTLLLGRGQAVERAWVFILLAREQGLDAVMLGLAGKDGGKVRDWLPAVLSGGELYLFDCRLGLPIPGPQGRGVATLSQVIADEQLLRYLDLDSEHPYPVKADDLKHLVAYIEASPSNLSRRMALVESRLSGQHKIMLTSPASAIEERLKKVPQLSQIKLWPRPFEIWYWQAKLNDDARTAAMREMMLFERSPTLMRGRALYFKGAYDGLDGAKKCFLDARPSQMMIEEYRLPPEVAKQVKRENIAKIEASQTLLMQRGKQDASFWLGLIEFEQKDYPIAVDFFAKRTLEAFPKGPWTAAARYNLARTYEASGDISRAVALYEADKSLQSHGNKLRARWLKEQHASAEAEPVATPP